MPVVFQTRITRVEIRANPHCLYLFGDNEARYGLGGQARECRGEPNVIGVATKRQPTLNEGDYWSDVEYVRCTQIIDRDLEPAFALVRKGGAVICPMAGLGTGLSELHQRAPRIYQYLRLKIIALKNTPLA